jgi:hypothetical protein
VPESRSFGTAHFGLDEVRLEIRLRAVQLGGRELEHRLEE